MITHPCQRDRLYRLLNIHIKRRYRGCYHEAAYRYPWRNKQIPLCGRCYVRFALGTHVPQEQAPIDEAQIDAQRKHAREMIQRFMDKYPLWQWKNDKQ